MSLLIGARTVLFIILVSVISIAGDNSTLGYQELSRNIFQVCTNPTT
jgi:hypothetical protein